jgi:hypothetical protein
MEVGMTVRVRRAARTVILGAIGVFAVVAGAPASNTPQQARSCAKTAGADKPCWPDYSVPQGAQGQSEQSTPRSGPPRN